MIVVLTGRKKAGKDTLASTLFKHEFIRISFSDQLKRICADLFPWLELDYPQEVKDQKIFNNETLSPRDIWLSLNVLTEIDRTILVRSLETELNKWTSQDLGELNFIITDLRKPEEYEWVQKMGYPIIKIIDGCSREGIVEDSLEDFIEQIVPNYEFVNNKDEDSKLRFEQFVMEDVVCD